MGGRHRDRDRRPARRASTRIPKRRLLALCEGKVTEPEYLRGYVRLKRNASLELEIAKERGAPLTLVELAVTRKGKAARLAKRHGDPFLAYDEVWCVFDVDEHPYLNDAVQLAAANGINLAVSNPCFELWLVLHFRESPGSRHRDEVQRLLERHLPNYDKHLDFNLVASLVPDAERRARRLDADAEEEGEAGRNPTTGMHRLTESISRDA